MQWLLILLSIVGVVLGFKNKRVWLLVSFVVYYLLIHAIILVQIRYLYPTVPALILLSSYALLRIWNSFTPEQQSSSKIAKKQKTKTA